jgi:PASTA domain
MRWKTLAIVLTAVALFLGGVITGRGTDKNRTEGPVGVPAFTSRTLEQILPVLARLHLRLDVRLLRARVDPSPFGTVLSQSPAPRSVVPVGTTLSLVLSAGPHPRMFGGPGPPKALVGGTCDLYPQLALAPTPCGGGPLYVPLERT